MLGSLLILSIVYVTHGRPQENNQFICPDGSQEKIPHEKDCSKFYYCDNSRTQVVGQCEPGMEFSFELQKCTEPSVAKCYKNAEKAEQIHRTKREAILPNGCPEDFGEHKLLPHETNCSQFYYCVYGQKVLRECNSGTYFNNDSQICDYPENVKCDVNNTRDEGNDASRNVRGIRNNRVIETLPNGCPNQNIHFLLPHETNCSRFYYCVWGEKQERECPPKTHFNPTLQVCDWPKNAGCKAGGGGGSESGNEGGNGNGNSSGCNEGGNGGGSEGDNGGGSEGSNGGGSEGGSGGGSEGGGGNGFLPNGCPSNFSIHWLLPHESDCTKFYYCVFGEKVERVCSSGTHFNPSIQVCDWPWAAGCASGDGGNETLPNGCPANFTIHWLLPHEIDCTKFYYCMFGNRVERNCAPGTHFNPTLQVCDWPWAAGCASGGGGGGNETLPNGCPADFTIHWLLPHETDCTKFYYCVFGNKVERNCAPGTHFNPTLQVCDWPWHAGCASDGGGGGGNETLPNGCPADFTIHWVLPHETDCTKFYYCVFGNKVERNCAPGTHFNPTLQVCDWPWAAGCASGGGGGGNETLPNGCPADFTIHWLLPHETDCTKFYYCVFGNKVERNCAPGTHFNPTLQVCDWPWHAGCASDGGGGGGNETLPNGCPADFTIHWVLPHETDCTKFYYCVFGNKVERNCAPGTHFNPTLQVCDWPWNAGCDSNCIGCESLPNGCPSNYSIHHLLPHDTECSKFYQCVFGEKVERDCPTGTHFNPTLQICDSPSAAGCVSDPNGDNDCGSCGGSGCQSCTTWGHETDCDKYWKCVNGKKVKFVCPEGLNFNAKTQMCDFICNAACVRSEVQSTARDDGLSIFLPWDKIDSIIEFSRAYSLI